MNSLVTFLWLGAVTGLGAWSLLRGSREYRAGSAKIMGWPRFERTTQPVNFWIAITGRAMGVLGTVVLLFIFVAWS